MSHRHGERPPFPLSVRQPKDASAGSGPSAPPRLSPFSRDRRRSLVPLYPSQSLGDADDQPPSTDPAPFSPTAALDLPKAFELIPFPRERKAAGRGGSLRTPARSACAVPICMGAIVRLLAVLDALDRAIALAVRREFVIPSCLDRRR